MNQQIIHLSNEWINQWVKEEKTSNTTIQTSQLNSWLDFKATYLTSFHTTSERFTNFVSDRHSLFVFTFIHFNNNSKMYLDAAITETRQRSSQKCDTS